MHRTVGLRQIWYGLGEVGWRRAKLRGQWVGDSVAAEGGGDVVQALQAAPEGLGTGLAVGFAGEETAELGDQEDHLAERRRLRRRRLAGVEDDQGLPLLGLEGDGTGQFGGGPPEPGEIVDAPGDDHVDGEAGFQTVGGFELAIFNAASALEDAVEDLDPPAPGIPLHALESVVQRGDRHGGQQHPVERLDVGWRVFFAAAHDP